MSVKIKYIMGCKWPKKHWAAHFGHLCEYGDVKQELSAFYRESYNDNDWVTDLRTISEILEEITIEQLLACGGSLAVGDATIYVKAVFGGFLVDVEYDDE